MASRFSLIICFTQIPDSHFFPTASREALSLQSVWTLTHTLLLGGEFAGLHYSIMSPFVTRDSRPSSNESWGTLPLCFWLTPSTVNILTFPKLTANLTSAGPARSPDLFTRSAPPGFQS